MEIGKILRAIGSVFVQTISLVLFSIYVYTEKLFRLFIPRTQKSLDGEIILITGTGNGIGKQIALKLAIVAPNARLICWDYEEEPNMATVAELRQKNIKADGYTIDISDSEMVAKTAAQIRSDIGDVTIVINNAGISPYTKFLSQDISSMRRTMEINVYAHFWILREFLPKMIEKNHGHVVSMASMAALVPSRELAVYGASKHAIHGFIESLKTEFRIDPLKSNISFTTVYPYFVSTRMISSVKFRPGFASLVPVISPEYVAEKTIQGFRRNYEHIYLPPVAQMLTFVGVLFPQAIWAKLQDFLKYDIDYTRQNHSPQTGIPNNYKPLTNG
jgi:all-trans-retinol dehydrogenase (NAD+)